MAFYIIITFPMLYHRVIFCHGVARPEVPKIRAFIAVYITAQKFRFASRFLCDVNPVACNGYLHCKAICDVKS